MIATRPREFLEALPAAGRLAGLDVGTKTIGIALCDAQWTIASPAETIRRTKFTADKAALAALVARQLVKGLVLGLPLSMDGTDSPRTQSVRAFARNLADSRAADPALGRALVHRRRHPHPDRRRRQPRAARRAGRQDGGGLHPPGRDRCARLDAARDMTACARRAGRRTARP